MEQGHRRVGLVVGIEEGIGFLCSRPARFRDRSNLDPDVIHAGGNTTLQGLEETGKTIARPLAKRPMQANAIARRLQRRRRDQRGKDRTSLFVRQGDDVLAVTADGQLQVLTPFENGIGPEIFEPVPSTRLSRARLRCRRRWLDPRCPSPRITRNSFLTIRRWRSRISDEALVAMLKLPPVRSDNSLNSRTAVACSSRESRSRRFPRGFLGWNMPLRFPPALAADSGGGLNW